MAWAMVIVAGLFETAFAVSLKLSEGFSRLGWSLAFISSAAISFGLLSWVGLLIDGEPSRDLVLPHVAVRRQP